ncbi:class I SAM-dependent methyltransferase [Bradyrhizobium jicamae]|uniref:Class I SAM-dependent methyltransferase n=1 Tax=Bradyrhizobium jicamae TaxID=280332 RepID=A0ABS5FRD5_9BRAD|nr:class I SAM-dependent methyltransferase [Bradyrhizobium jicamae]MBR0799369.1 class I SAM-dependent methyltransferase [Bradyrhizobium jicamae]
MANAYDHVRYPSLVQEGLHPAAISVFACLHDLPFVPASDCRVLEIGCGEGANLMSIAATSPRSKLVGFDLAETAIANGRARAAAAKLANVEFSVMDILKAPDSLGEFDYIIAHGVYAWVPAPVREALMRLIGRALSRQGLALISYNAMPGCRVRQIVRDILLDCLAGTVEIKSRLAAAREWLEFLAANWSASDPLQHAMREEANYLLLRPPEVLFHDEMGDTYEPQFVSDVAAHAKRYGLQYICDAQPARGCEALIPSAERQVLRERTGEDWVQFEQQYDYATLLPYRETLLCKDSGIIDRTMAWTRVRRLHAHGEFIPVDEAESGKFEFRTRGDGRASTSEASIATLLGHIGAAKPQSIPLANEIDGRKLAETVLRMFRTGALSLQSEPFQFTLTPSEYPMASALARIQAARGETAITTLRHTTVNISDTTTRHFVTLLDGTRTRNDLALEMMRFTALPETTIVGKLKDNLNSLAQMALLAA